MQDESKTSLSQSSDAIHVTSKSATKPVRFWSTQDELPWSLSGVLSPTVSTHFWTKHALSGVLSPTVSTHFSSKSALFGDLLNKLPPSQWLILPKSGEIRGASFTSETENVTRAKAPR